MSSSQYIQKLIQYYALEKSIDYIYNYALEKILEILDAKYAYLSKCVYDENDKILYQQLVSITDDILTDSTNDFLKEFPLDEGLSCYKFTRTEPDLPYNKGVFTKKPCYFNDINKRLKHIKHCPFFPKGNVMDNYVNIPLIFSNRVLGSIGISCRKGGFNEESLEKIYPLVNTLIYIEISNNRRIKLTKFIETQSKFLGNMSHDLRNPMNAIIGVLQLLSSETISPEANKYINIAKEASTSMLTLIDDLLIVCSIKEGKIKLNSENFDLSKELFKIVNNMKTSSKKSIMFLFQYNPCIPKNVYIDKTKIKQIFTNILSNAEKFTDEGSIICKVDYEEPNFIIEIKDTGRGIDFTKINKNSLFSNRFIREETKTQGTGLGLSIVKNIVDLMKGDIDVESDVGVGTVFTIKLPLPLTTDNLESENVKQTYYPYNILLIEDNYFNQEILKTMIVNMGCKIYIANNGKEGIKLWKNNIDHLDIIITDYYMPIKNGYETVKEIRKYEKRHNLVPVYIVGMTASVNVESKKCIKGGMNIFLEKPINKNKIIEILDEYKNTKN